MEIRNLRNARFLQNVFIIILFQCLNFSFVHGLYLYGNNTQKTLCSAQCETLCLDRVPNCEGLCNGTKTWVTNCDGPNCPGTCSVLQNRYNYQINNLVPPRTLHIEHSDGTSFDLTWDVPTATPLTTIFIIEQKRLGEHNASTVTMIGWIRGTRFKIDRAGVCDNSSYRVMAVNQFGSMGFSNYIKIPGVTPGLLENLKYSGQGVYYYKNTSLFMAILEWNLPAGWQDTDIKRYEINPVVKTFCKDMNHQSLPLFRQMLNQSKDARILMTISASSIGCVYTPEIRAVSKCGVYGPWTGFTVDLTNCSAITGYQCKPKQFDPPGNAENVSLAVSPMQPPSPFAVDLHILWQPPTDLGSVGKIDKYMIRSGKAKQLMFPLPAIFTETPMIRNVSQDIREMIFQLQTEQSPFTYGVQVIPYAPGQYISENEMGMLPMQTIHVGHNDSMAPFKKQGTILYDSNDTVIVYMNKTMPLQFMFNTQTRSRNSSIDRLALEWGPLVGPNRLDVENRTIVPMNQSELRIYLDSSGKEYGLKMKYLCYNEDEPSDTVWDTVSVMSFKMPDVKDEEIKQEKLIQDEIDLLPVYVLVPTITVIVLVIVCLRLGIRRQHFKNLEQRLAEIDEEVDENGEVDHYYIMRAQEDGTEGLAPTVVPDAWELPHTCLKIGRTLGSGAFGQVVRGRISRSLLAHRGIDLHGSEGKSGLFVTVAVKMLQEYTEDRYRQDFLNEIKMMKDIGYHRNIVSILGCCTLREPYCLIVEHVPYGDLLTYLRKIRYKLQEREDDIGNYVNQEVELFSPLDLLSVARQITLGMEYLSQKGFVHRDLAARNILVGKNKTVKIGDFGLARFIYHDVGKVYVNRRGGKLPLKWMSVEAIFDLTFSSASDVWAFGVLLFEIVTLGGSPYPLVSNADLLQELRNGYRMERPENCSEEIYEIMLRCWQTNPSDRPTFTQLQETFTTMLQRDSGQAYFSFDINEEREYYKINSDEMDETVAVIEAEQEAESKTALGTLADVPKETSFQARICTESIVASSKETRDHLPEAQFDLHDTEHKTNADIDGTLVTEPAHSKTCAARDLYGGRLTNTAGNDDTVSINSESSVALARNRRAVSELDRLSGSSDEVFMDCPGCLKLSGGGGSVRTCPECQKTRIALTMFDLHGVDRNDSAISSATSDELKSDDGQSSKISVSSSEDYTLPIYDSRKRLMSDIKVSVKKTLSAKYYDETSITELIKKYPAWTERGSIIDRGFGAYETVGSDLVDEKLVHMTGNTDICSDKLDLFPEYYPRHRFFSDPYCNYQLDIGKENDWSVVETRM